MTLDKSSPNCAQTQENSLSQWNPKYTKQKRHFFPIQALSNQLKTKVTQSLFFTKKKVKSVKLLYKASQSQFLVSRWHEKCDDIANTLTIVETEFGKVIGGFTSMRWSRKGEWISAVNNEEDQFMFSLTNNHKLVITQNNQYCIYCDSNDNQNGPIFGGGNDLAIHNKANMNNYSSTNPGYVYTNPNYQYNDKESQVKFAGGYQFRIKQWEVWQVGFICD